MKLLLTRLTKLAGAGAGKRDERPVLSVYPSRSIYSRVKRQYFVLYSGMQIEG